MGYYSAIALAVPESEWETLVSETQNVEFSACEIRDSLIWFERTETDANNKWVLVRWHHIQWNPFLNKSVDRLQRYIDLCEGPYEFVRVGEEINDVEYASYQVEVEMIGVQTEIETYL